LGQEVWNYPAYNFSSEAHFRDERHVEVRLKLGCVDFLPYEVDKAPKKPLDLHFHYLLTLNEDGEIVDGTYLYDSKRIDMLWVPMTATRGGTAGNEDGNPHIDPDVIIGMWRESVPETLRTTWYVVDPLPEDAVLVSDWFHVSPTADDARLEYIPDLTQDRAANLESAAERTPTAPHQARTASAETEPAAEQYSVTATTDGQAPSSDAAVESTDQQSSHDVVVEVVRERFPDGSLKAEREVTLDSDLNYINHGMYRLWWESGALRAEGRLEHGRRVGVWRRIYAKNESDLFSEMPFKFFREPFLSTATFRDERLHGKWSIRDSEDRTVREINFVDGVRNGSSVYFFPNGSKMREASFRNGFLHGLLSEFNEQGEVLVEHNYIDGHHCSNEVECSASIR
jgi:antitoxin component YwqK of YwqJK toxin-antitoxin module